MQPRADAFHAAVMAGRLAAIARWRWRWALGRFRVGGSNAMDPDAHSDDREAHETLEAHSCDEPADLNRHSLRLQRGVRATGFRRRVGMDALGDLDLTQVRPLVSAD